MPYNLTEEEQTRLMEAVQDVLEPWLWVDPERTITALWHKSMFEGTKRDPDNDPDCEKVEGTDNYLVTFKPRMKSLKPDTPDEVKRLNEVFLDIIEKGAIIGGKT